MADLDEIYLGLQAIDDYLKPFGIPLFRRHEVAGASTTALNSDLALHFPANIQFRRSQIQVRPQLHCALHPAWAHITASR